MPQLLQGKETEEDVNSEDQLKNNKTIGNSSDDEIIDNETNKADIDEASDSEECDSDSQSENSEKPGTITRPRDESPSSRKVCRNLLFGYYTIFSFSEKNNCCQRYCDQNGIWVTFSVIIGESVCIQKLLYGLKLTIVGT